MDIERLCLKRWNDMYDEYECYYPEKDIDNRFYNDAKEWVEEIVFQMYEEGNVERMDRAIQELAAFFCVDVPNTDIKFNSKTQQ